jgi:hypothetical protein
MRAHAAAHFEFDRHIQINWPDAVALLQSEYTGGPDGRAYPVTLFGEIRGEAPSLDEAQQRLSSALGNALPIVALAANAAIDDPLPIGALGLDVSEPREFMWYATPRAEDWFPVGARTIDPEATLALMTAVGTNPNVVHLLRAIESYRRALSNWVPERRLMAGEFLFIAAETLSRFLVEARSSGRGITPRNLARLEGLADQDTLRSRYLHDEIFAGDGAALDAMQNASNGFEHGYMKTPDVLGLIDSALERSMTAVRRALIGASGLADDAADTLLGGYYAEPRGIVPPIHVIRGEIARVDAALPADPTSLDIDYPRPRAVVTSGAGESLEVELPSIITATHIPDNVQLRNLVPGLRAAYHTKVAPSRVSITPAPPAAEADTKS